MTLVIIFGSLFVLLSTFGLAAILFWPATEAGLAYLFERGNPVYDGIELNIARDEVSTISIGNDSQIPKQFFILINGSPKRLQDATVQDFLDIGFERDTTPGLLIHGNPLVQIDFVEMSAKGLTGMYIRTDKIQFSTSKDGPFLKLPVPYEKFKEQFGEPKSYIRRKSNWRDPR
ncbi:hypothetical protein Pan97_27180 [Bremerella volcania]|uniref:Uncharacterized protein n=1 Tax=Bremerella volcania TaxID=2527984 RepID=A0A518C917_9BACT|nr:hypothetical protein [Bremerella volcania]QDU75684.1 hypothetical protein Pan97_27180 [Bremerella volcania]